MYEQTAKQRVWFAVSVVTLILIIIGIIIAVLYNSFNKNPYGNGVTIANYDQKIKNLPEDRKQSIESTLYNVIKQNLPSNTPAPNISDAVIRDGSNQQAEVLKGKHYRGTFIVDIPSIKQSYRVDYTYSTDPNDGYATGNPVNITCLPLSDLKYGDFHCKGLTTQQSQDTDPIIKYLPYETFDYKIWADTTSGKLIVYANLVIPPSDLTTNLASNQQVVAMYKKEVTDWIQSNSFDPSKYTINYNYDDNGNVIRQ